jgi:hypothetical protein
VGKKIINISHGLCLADIRNATKTISIDLAEYGFEGAEPLEVTFRTNFWTAKAQEEYVVEGNKVAESDIALLLESVKSWNLTDEGESVPITKEILTDVLGFNLVHGIVNEMIESIYPNRTTSGT